MGGIWPWIVGIAAGAGALLAARAASAARQNGGTMTSSGFKPPSATASPASGGASPPATSAPSAPAGGGPGRDTASGVSISNGVATGPGGVSYTFTDEDKLWLGRALYGESGTSQLGGAAVAWSMINNYLTGAPRRGTRFHQFNAFWRLLRAYCQPINPAWMDPTGTKCRQQPAACTERHINRRRTISAMPWTSIPQSVRLLTESFLAGTLANPVPDSTGWNMRRWRDDNIEVDGNYFGRERR